MRHTLTDLLQADMTRAYEKLRPITAAKVVRWWRLARFGSKPAHENLAVICYPMMLKAYKSLGLPRDHMDDCIAEGLMAVRRAVNTFQEGKKSFRSWAYQYIRTYMLRESKRLGERLHTTSLSNMETVTAALAWKELVVQETSYTEEEVASFPFEECRVEERIEAAELRRSILRLPDRQRELMTHILSGLNNSEAGVLMDITQQAADKLYRRAIKRLRSDYQLVSQRGL